MALKVPLSFISRREHKIIGLDKSLLSIRIRNSKNENYERLKQNASLILTILKVCSYINNIRLPGKTPFSISTRQKATVLEGRGVRRNLLGRIPTGICAHGTSPERRAVQNRHKENDMAAYS